MSEITISGPRFVFPAPVMEKFSLTQSDMILLTRQHFPDSDPDTILLALTIAASHGLSWKLKPIEVMPFNTKVDGEWIKKQQLILGLNFWRFKAQQSGRYMGCDPTKFGPMQQIEYVKAGKDVQKITVKVAEWAQMTIKVKAPVVGLAEFAGPRVMWDEVVRTTGDGKILPLHAQRPMFVLEKSAEVGAIRRAFGYDMDPSLDPEYVIEQAAQEAAPDLENANISKKAAVDDVADAIGYEEEPKPATESKPKKEKKPAKKEPEPEPEQEEESMADFL